MCKHNYAGYLCDECKRDISKRKCNNCGKKLNPNSPNWFQCSDKCRQERYDTCHPKKQEEWDDI